MMQYLRSYFSSDYGKSKSKIDIENPTNLINNERVLREIHSQKALQQQQQTSSEEKQRSNIFEQFQVVGVKNKNAEPEVMFRYPPTSAGVPDIVSFCYPYGVKARHLRRTPSMSSLYELLCHQTDLSHSPNTFIFILTTKDYEIFYGVCVRKDESVEHYPSFIKKEEVSCSSEESSKISKSNSKDSSGKDNSITIAPRCYVLVSRYPFFQLFFEVLHGILSMEHVYHITQPYIQPHRTSSVEDPSSEHSSLLQKNSDKQNKKTPGFQNEFQVEDKKEVVVVGDAMQVLQKFFKLVIPNPGQPVEFKLSNSKTIHFSRSVIDEEDEALREWGLTLTIHTISKKHFFTMVNAFILEKKVAFVSQNLRILSSVVLSFLTLVRPFIYQSAVIPILPLKMMSLLEAPVPFIVGITQMPDKIPSDVIILNLDDGLLHQQLDLPILPRFKAFDEFPALYSELKKTWVKDEIPYVPTSKQLRLSKRIAQLFNRSLTSMFETFRQHCITDMSERNVPITIFIKESFLETVNPDYLSWYSTMVETQMFFHYVDNRLRKMDRKPI